MPWKHTTKRHGDSCSQTWKHLPIPQCGICKAYLFLSLTMCAWICLDLSDLLSSGESVYTNPESSTVKRLDLNNFRLLLLHSDIQTELLFFITAGRGREDLLVTFSACKRLRGSARICASWVPPNFTEFCQNTLHVCEKPCPVQATHLIFEPPSCGLTRSSAGPLHSLASAPMSWLASSACFFQEWNTAK